MCRGSLAALLATVLLVSSIFVACGPAKGTAEWNLDQGNNLAEQSRHDKAIEE